MKRVTALNILMKPSLITPSLDQRVILDRRSHPTSFLSTLKLGGRRRRFRRKGEGRNQYVDRPSFRTIVLTVIIVTLSAFDAIFTIFQLKNGASELNPLMGQTIQGGFESLFIIIKSLGIGLMACFLAIHQNFKMSFYGIHLCATIYIVLLAYHLAYSYLFQVV